MVQPDADEERSEQRLDPERRKQRGVDVCARDQLGLVAEPDGPAGCAPDADVVERLLDELARRSADAYRSLVWEDPAFEAYGVPILPA